MSNDGEDHIDFESEDENDLDYSQTIKKGRRTGKKFNSLAEKRAHHNELERERRDGLKNRFAELCETVPLFDGQKPSRAQILRKSVDYILNTSERITEQQQHIAEMKQENIVLENEISILEKLIASGSFQQLQAQEPSANIIDSPRNASPLVLDNPDNRHVHKHKKKAKGTKAPYN